MRRTAKWIEVHGVREGRTFTDSPYSGHRGLLVVGASRICPKHVTLHLEEGRTMLVDNQWPVIIEKSRR